ncbi:MAG: glycoside hydrolase family 88 protein [Bacteroidales bacterium]|nr:MAG: glycoside hydrolase family 88 protein [Bacteroidales bacterium]
MKNTGDIMKSVFTVCFLFILILSGCSQTDKTDINVLYKVADYNINHADFSFVGVQNRQTYTSTKDIPEDVEIRFKSHLAGWHYTNGVLNMAMINLSDFSGEEKYFDFAAKHIAFGMDNYKFFQKRFKKDRPHYYYPFGQLWTMSELDDCGAMGASMIDVYQKVRKKEYKEYIENAARHITEVQERLDDGTLVRTFPHAMTLWADDLYMSVPFLARMGKFSGDGKYFDDAVSQVFNFTKYLWNKDKELYYHCYYSDLERNGVAHWGRCNGWVMMAQVHLLNHLPADHPERDDLIKILERQILGIAKYQNGDGLWHQLLDRTDSYLESSCSAMFTYCIARAVNQGWIDERYGTIAIRGWNGLKDHKITPDGQVKDICVGTGIEDNMVFYYNRPARLNETHGLGAVIEAGIEVIKLKRNLSQD